MSALAIIPSLFRVGLVLWACCTETPPIVACREVGEDELDAADERGHGDEF